LLVSLKTGAIDKYISDSIMTLVPGSPDDAPHAALEFEVTMPNFNNKYAIATLGEEIITGIRNSHRKVDFRNNCP
jgi:hypothetical protein